MVFKHKETVRLSTRHLGGDPDIQGNFRNSVTESVESPDKRKKPGLGLQIQIDDDNGEPMGSHSGSDNGDGNELSNLERAESFNNMGGIGGSDFVNAEDAPNSGLASSILS